MTYLRARARGTLRALLFVALFLLLAGNLSAQKLRKMEFRNQPVTDILLALAEVSGHSIVPDETVSGTASFYFSDASFEDVFANILAANKLFVRQDGNTYFVSRVWVVYDRERNLVSMKADEVDILYLVRALSQALGRTIVYDPLPRLSISVNMDALSPDKALEILGKRLPDYRVEADASYFFIRKVAVDPRVDSVAGRRPVVTRKGEEYSLLADKALFSDVVKALFASAGKEYSLLTQSDGALANLNFSGKSFDDLLRLVLEQGNADVTLLNGVYYIFEIQRKDVVKKLKTTTTYALKYLSIQDLSAVLPADLAASGSIRTDKATNSIMLTGSMEEIGPVVDYIQALDRPLEGRSYRRYDIHFLKVKDVVALLPSRLLPVAPIVLPEGNSFVALVAEENAQPLRDFLDMVDRKSEGYPVHLRFIKSEELMKSLPPSVSKDDIMESGVPSVVFFVGSEAKREIFLRELAILDRPKPQIRYELLVIQYTRSQKGDWSTGFTATKDSKSSSTPMSLVAELSNLLSLNFDIVAQFGILFSMKLDLSLTTGDARVYADTTLNAISGQEVKYQNTHTFRYAKAVYDDTTKKYVYTGSSTEVTSGLLLSLNGWVSGDGVITMTVSATMSNEDTQADETSMLPSTAERVVTTTVRTASGTPIVIGGLLWREKTFDIKKVPVLGDIPLLGLLFQQKTEGYQDTEYVVYVVPHVTYAEENPETLVDRGMEEYYTNFLKGLPHD